MKIKLFATIILVFLTFTACTTTGSEQPQGEPEAEVIEDISKEAETETEQIVFPATEETEYWSVTVNEVKVAGSLTGTLDSVQYTGEIIQTPVNAAPADGNMFVLVNLSIEKTKSGKAVFLWDDTAVTDADGNSYSRHENDTFLDTMNYQRIKASDLTLGTSTGWACYEVPEEGRDLSFTVTTEDGKVEIKLM